ncbi:MAG: LacI family DNA-binding transcriptional regulator [Clostridia bacterium]|nr:LacI family DNA-binding transcriptional regulator [Clostridia bacterium]
MEKRVTIKDIAGEAGVSLGSVHCALNGKPGVGEATRRRILEIARRQGYRPNAVASSLKRRPIRVAAAFPGATEESQFYYAFIWEGIRDWFRAQGDFNLVLLEAPFYPGPNSQADELAELMAGQGLDGLITTGYTDARGMTAVQDFIEKGVPVVLVGNDLPGSGRLCCVQPDYRIIGRMLAELLTSQIPPDGGILLCAGDVIMPSHYLIVQGFDAYMAEQGCRNPVYKLHESGDRQALYAQLLRELSEREGLAACCSVNARNSVLLGKALLESGRAGGLRAVGSDLFAENVDFLKRGVFTNLLYKKPYSLANIAARYMTDYLLRDERPPRECVCLGSELIFKSSLPMYDNGLYRQLL